MIKKVCLVSFIAIVMGVVFFHHALHTLLLKTALHYYTTTQFGEPLHYQTAHLDEGHLILISPHFENDDFFMADRMDFSFETDIWKRQINFTIHFERPQFHLEKEKTRKKGLEKTKKLFNSEKRWLHFHPKILIKEGVLTWLVRGEQQPPLYFDLDFDGELGGKITALFNDHTMKGNTFTMEALSGAEAMVMSIECQNLNGAPLFALIQQLSSSFTSWKIPSCRLNGQLKGVFPYTQRPYFEGEMEVGDLGFKHETHSLAGHIEQAKLSLVKDTLNLQDGLQAVLGELNISKPSRLTYEDREGKIWKIDHILGKVILDGSKQAIVDFSAKGVYQKHETDLSLYGKAQIEPERGLISHITFQLSGLKGGLDIEWGKAKELVTIKLEADADNLFKFLPHRIKERLKPSLIHDKMTILANVKKRYRQLELVGTTHIKSEGKEDVDLVHFGCELKAPTSQNPFFTPVGWFSARNIPLEKYLSPFLFRPGVLMMSGRGAFKGSFDLQSLVIKYDVEDLQFENEHLLVKAQYVHSSIPGELQGFHRFDFTNHTHQGELPLRQASYTIKKSGLVFEDIGGTAHFSDHVVSIKDMEAYCHDVYFAGSLDLDYSNPDPGVFDLAIHSPIFSGKVSQIEQILAHIDHEALLSKIPLEGDLSGRGKGLELAFAFFSDDYHLKADIEGAVHNGVLAFESSDLSLKGLYMDVDYHHAGQTLAFTDIQGSLLVGKPRCVEEYHFGGDHIRFKDLVKRDIDLDIWVKDHDEELIRVAATSEPKEDGLRHLMIDKAISHISQIYPKEWTCCLKGWSGVEEFSLQSDFLLTPFLTDLLRFRKTGLFCFSHQLLDSVAHLGKTEGEMNLNVTYNPQEGAVDYILEGNGIQSTHHCVLKGKKRDKKWLVDLFQWDKLNLFAELEHEEGSWKINSLGFNDGEALLLGLKGDLLLDEGVFKGKVNLCEIKLERLKEWSFLQPTISEWDPKGILRATGEISLELLPDAPWYRLKTDLQAAASQVSLKGSPVTFPNGILNGSASIDKHIFNAKIEEGTCTFSGTDFDLKDIDVTLKDHVCNFQALAQYARCPLQIVATANWPACDHGEWKIVDLTFNSANSFVRPLTLSWHKNGKQQLVIQALQGQFCGLWFDLYSAKTVEKEEWTTLQGKIDIDFNSLTPLLSQNVADKIYALKLGSFFTLDGLYTIHLSPKNSVADSLFFEGSLTSQDAIIKGYQLSRLDAKVHYSPNRMEIDNLQIDDPAGNLWADHLLVLRDEKSGDWSLDMPHLTVKKFKPGLLREPGDRLSDASRFKTLLIKKLDLYNFRGDLANTDSWNGQGNFYFQNTKRQNAFHPLLAIPNEIILRLGLDPNVLNPVTGGIFFKVEGDRFYLTKMKDVYSEGRGSKFYLADSKTSSWMDMDGNLSLQIKMKQYNLLFKIAELFTVSIDGNLQKPVYSLQKQR